jgi:serine/threonine-protein kinase
VRISRLVAVTSTRSLLLERPSGGTGVTDTFGLDTRAPSGGGATAMVELAPDHARYSLLELLGRGAMGEVHLARDEDLLRKVAVKRMAPEVLKSPPLAARFFDEAQITAQLDHPHIVPVYGIEVGSDGALGYSMKLVQGRTLTALLADAAIAERKDPSLARTALSGRLEVFLKVCDAIAFAHERGVIHRDLKPDNIMVGRHNEVYVMDWGICRVIRAADRGDGIVLTAPASKESPSERTQIGQVMGTPLYMSPEQASGRNAELDGRSDLYTLGLILQELVTLQRARQGVTLDEVIVQAVSGSRAAPEHVNPNVSIPRELRAIVARAAAAEPSARYASVDELGADLRRFLRGDAVAAEPDSWLQAMARKVARNRLKALAVMASALLLAASSVILTLNHERSALAARRIQEQARQSFLTAVQQRAHAIDDRFLRDERYLGELASRATEVLAHADVRNAPAPYFDDAFDSPRSAPPDLASSPFYHRPISLGWPVIKLAPGIDRRTVDHDVRMLSLLAPAERATVEAGVDGDDRSSRALRARFAEHGGEIVRAFVSLESGVHASYPGVGGFGAGYDPRKRPKYLLAAGKTGIRWGNPYLDPFGLGTVLPASVALHAEDGAFLGVVGIVTTFDHIREKLLKLPGAWRVVRAYLVDDDGNVVTQTDEERIAGGARPPGGDLEIELPVTLRPLDIPRVRDAIVAHGAGYVELGRSQGSRIVAYYPLSSLGWYYVVETDPATLPGGA